MKKHQFLLTLASFRIQVPQVPCTDSLVTILSNILTKYSHPTDGNKLFVTKAEYVYQKSFNNYSEMEREQNIYKCKLAYKFICVYTYFIYIHIYTYICKYTYMITCIFIFLSPE